MTKTHIAGVGENTTHVLVAFKELGFDKLYLFTGKKFEENAEKVRTHLEPFNVQVEITIVDPFKQDSMNSILSYILKIIKECGDDEIFINITGGTNLMGAVSLSAAYFTKSNAYYVLDSRIDDNKDKNVMLPVPNISYSELLSDTQRDLLIKLKKELDENGPIENIRNYAEKINWSQQRIKPHLDILEEKGIICIDRKDKQHKLSVSRSGEIIIQFIK